MEAEVYEIVLTVGNYEHDPFDFGQKPPSFEDLLLCGMTIEDALDERKE